MLKKVVYFFGGGLFCPLHFVFYGVLVVKAVYIDVLGTTFKYRKKNGVMCVLFFEE